MNWQDGEAHEGWTLCSVGDIAKVVGGGTPRTSVPGNFSDVEGHPWITPADLTGCTDKYVGRGRRFLTDQGLSTSSAKYMPAGTVLFSSRAPIGYVAIAANPVTTNQGFRSFVPSDSVDSGYLYHALHYLRPVAEQLASGTTFAELSGTNAARLPIAFPSLEEQRAIVGVLDKTESLRRESSGHLTAARSAIERFRQALLAAACSGRLTAAWREGHEGSQSACELRDAIESQRRAVLGRRWKQQVVSVDDRWELPSSWAWSTPEQLSRPDRSITYGVIKLGHPVADGVPTLRSSDVRWLRIDETHVKQIDQSVADNYRRTYLEGGELVVTVRGTLGGVAVVPTRMAGWNVSREVAVIPLVSDVHAPYVAYAIASSQCQRWMAGVARGVAYTGVNIEDLRRLPVPLPPVEEQAAIVERVEMLMKIAGALISRIDGAVARVERSSGAVLAKAFRGELGSREGSRCATESVQ